MARQTTTRERTAQDQQQASPAPRDNLPAQQQKHPLVAFKSYMDERMASLVQALPPHISPNAFTSVVLTALQRKPDLLKCTRQSLWNACILAAQDGLLPDGREGAIAPYGESTNGQRSAEIATWMPMVEGYRKKARNSGEISKWEVNVVRARDVFKVSLGDNAEIVHEPYFGIEEPGPVVGAYSIATLRDGSVMRDVMTIRDIEKIKAKSKAQRGPWSDATFFPEMCRKTMARRHYKQLPHSSEMDKMIERDDQEFGLDDPNSAQAVADRSARRLTSTSAAFDQFAHPGPTIDHDPDTGEIDGTDDSCDPPADEFADNDPPQNGRKPTGGIDRAAQQQENRASGKQREPAKEAKQTPSEPKQEPQKQPDPPTQEDPDYDGLDDEDSATDDGGEAGDRFPPGMTPTTEPEYVSYVGTKLADWDSKTEFDTGTSQILGADGIASWWKSKGERDLRTACGVQETTFHDLLGKCRERAAEIRKGK